MSRGRHGYTLRLSMIPRLLVSVLLITLACGALYLGLVQPLILSRKIQSWPEVSCVVVSSNVINDSYRTRKNLNTKKVHPSYKIGIHYSYRYSDKSYSSDRYNFDRTAETDPAVVQKLVNAFPAGAQCVCYVNPQNPSEAVLNKEVHPAFLIVLGGVGILLFGVAIMFFAKKVKI